MPLIKISKPIKIKIAPPKIVAFPAKRVPKDFPRTKPPIQIPNVTTAIIKEQTKAINQLYSEIVQPTERASTINLLKIQTMRRL